MDLLYLFAVAEMFVGWEIGNVTLPEHLDPWPVFEWAGEVIEFWSPR